MTHYTLGANGMEPSPKFRELLKELSAEFERLHAENQKLTRDTASHHLEHRYFCPPSPAEKPVNMDGFLPGNVIDPEETQYPVAIRNQHMKGALESSPRNSQGEIVRIPSKENMLKENVSSSYDTKKNRMIEKLSSGAIGQHAVEDPSEDVFMESEGKAPQDFFERIASSIIFEFFFSALIFINAIVLAFQVQYNGIDMGYKLGHEKSPKPAEDAWPGAVTVFNVLEVAFGITFCIELILKILGLRKRFYKSLWNWLDVIVVMFWLMDQIGGSGMFMNPMVLRLMRLSKIFRLARMLRTIQAFDPLNVMLGSIQASVSILFWSVILLFLVQMGVALFLGGLLEDYIGDESIEEEKRVQVYLYFGTFTRAMVTMFELSLGNWIIVCRVLIENVNEWYGLLVLSYKLVVGFAVMKVITGVFLHETFKVTSSDDDLMMVQKRRASQKHVAKMEHLLREADESRDGYIQRDELKKVLLKPSVKNWLMAMEIEVGDADLLFDFLDNGDEKLSAEELVNGIARLKGAARSIDVVGIMKQTAQLHDTLTEIISKINTIEARSRWTSPADKKC